MIGQQLVNTIYEIKESHRQAKKTSFAMNKVLQSPVFHYLYYLELDLSYLNEFFYVGNLGFPNHPIFTSVKLPLTLSVQSFLLVVSDLLNSKRPNHQSEL